MSSFSDEQEETNLLRCPQCGGPVVIHRRYAEDLSSTWTFKCPGFKKRGAEFCDKGLLGKTMITWSEYNSGIRFRPIQAMINKQHRELLRMRGQPIQDDEGDDA